MMALRIQNIMHLYYVNNSLYIEQYGFHGLIMNYNIVGGIVRSCAYVYTLTL